MRSSDETTNPSLSGPDNLHPVLASCSALLLDLNGTFMFDQDRFGPAEDYHATYRSLGGRRLTAEAVRAGVDSCCVELEQLGHDPACFDAYPSVGETLRRLPATRDLPPPELALIEQVIANHEVGRIPAAYAATLQALARTHRLGLVSNVWSRKDLYVTELGRAGVLDSFEVTVFSSDGPSIKPSRALFDRAVAAFDLRRCEVVVVGDSLRCDVGGAAAAGLASVWIDHHREGSGASAADPDWTIGDLRELVEMPGASGSCTTRATIDGSVNCAT
jgi:FMN phosphatase YigB (HAD superfamily)